jgi:SET domain-containing protein
MGSLGSRVRVGSSEVHGRGLFARLRFRAGAHIGSFRGVPTKRDGEHVLWVAETDGRRFGIDGKNALRFLNHDRRPNAEFDGAELYATRNIQPGREILIDYGEDWA